MDFRFCSFYVALSTKTNSAQWGSLVLKRKAPVRSAVQRVTVATG